jgi:hypothetical protein
LWLAQRLGIDPGTGYRDPRRKDGGVDVVAWRSFMDGRPGFPVALAQCTIQEEALTKTTDIDVRLWATWLAMDLDPLSVLVLPGTIQRAGPRWRQLSSVVMVIERLRLVELLGRSTLEGLELGWADEITNSLESILLAHEITTWALTAFPSALYACRSLLGSSMPSRLWRRAHSSGVI